MVTEPTEIAFEEVPVWERVFEQLFLTNPDSNQDLKMTLTTDDPAFWPARLTADVSPGETVQVPIYFRPYRYGNFEGKLWVKSFFGQNTQQIEVPLRGFGEGDPPEIAWDLKSLDLGDVEVGEGKVIETTITNDGTGRLYVHRVEVLTEAGEPFEPGESPEERVVLPMLERFTVEGGGSRVLRVRFRPETKGTVRGNLRLRHNAPPGEGTISIPFEGRGG